MRKIIHIDMDAFFASVEQRDDKSLQGKPIAVGSSGKRGVISTASYEARKYGIRSAMPSQIAIKKCPQLIFVPPRYDVYKSVSTQIRQIFLEYTDLVEPLSLDEAYLDVTTNFKNIPFAIDVAKEIKERIFQTTQLTASAGVSINKFLAKIASDYNKPNGLFIIGPKKAEKFVESLPIERFFGIGEKTATKMHQMNIFTGKDLKDRSEDFLISNFGKLGKTYFLNARAIDNRSVISNRQRKSLGVEWTFTEDVSSLLQVENELITICEELANRITKSKFKSRTITLKLKFEDFSILTRSKTLPCDIEELLVLVESSREILSQIDFAQKVRLIGVSVNANEKGEDVFNVDRQMVIPFEEDRG